MNHTVVNRRKKSDQHFVRVPFLFSGTGTDHPEWFFKQRTGLLILDRDAPDIRPKIRKGRILDTVCGRISSLYLADQIFI
jgi:hypothetical protein